METLHIESPHFTPGEQLVSLIEDRFAHLEKKYHRIHGCDLVLRKNTAEPKDQCVAEAKMEVPGRILFASEKADNFEMAVRKLVDDLDHQLTGFKEELNERR